jgi:hypothetical protein
MKLREEIEQLRKENEAHEDEPNEKDSICNEVVKLMRRGEKKKAR